MNKFSGYITWLNQVGKRLNREIKPSKLAAELYALDSSPEDAVTDFGLFL
ncbi:hypothetical protein POP12_112 [Pectobacterium phage POP12]|nr:hypothetical protein POP12_112 [Pectobacterium phage POP12]